MTTSNLPHGPSENTPVRGVPVVRPEGVPPHKDPAVDIQPVAVLTEHRAVDREVVAIVVTNGLTPYLQNLLDSVHAQTLLPAQIIVVDVGLKGPLTLPDASEDVAPCPVSVLWAPRAKTFGQGVGAALKQVPGAMEAAWLWLLHDDTVARPDVLEHLVQESRNNTSVSVAGPKQIRLGSTKDLVHVGYSVALGGQRLSGVELTEFDQGQHDAREDVFAVSLNAALVRTSVWRELKSTDPTYGRYGDSLDFCRRARLAGHRVVVVPEAVVEHAQATLMGLRGNAELIIPDKPSVLDEEHENRTYFARLRSALYYSATSFPAAMVPLIWVASVLAAPFRSLARIAVKQPRQAVAELLAPLWLFTKLGNALGAALRMSAVKKVPRSALRELMISHREVVSHRRDLRLSRATLRKQLYGPSELDARDFKAVRNRRRGTLWFVFLALCAITIAAFWDMLPAFTGAKRIIGGALLPLQATLGDLWQSWTGGWVRDGLGASAPADPIVFTLMPFVGLAGGNAQLAVNLLVLLALILSGVGAWFAAGSITRALTVRAWVTILWVAAPSFLIGLSQGRLGAIITHAALPWLVLTLVRTFGLQQVDKRSKLRFRQQQQADALLEAKLTQATLAAQVEALTQSGSPGIESTGKGTDAVDAGSDQIPNPVQPGAGKAKTPGSARSLAALGGASLLFAVVVTGSPVLLLPGLIILALLTLFVPRARLLLVVPIPALALMGPLLVRAFVNWEHDGWRILFADPGVPFGYQSAPPWQNFLGLPVFQAIPNFSAGWSAFLGALLPFAVGAIVLVGALLALLRSGRRGTVVRLLWVTALIGFATALVSAKVVVASGASAGVTGWAGSGVSLGYMSLLGACAIGVTDLSLKASSTNFGWRQVSLGLATLLVFAVPVGTLVVWSQDRSFAEHPAALELLDRNIVPAVAQQMQTSGRQARVLAISPDRAESVDYQLFHGDGSQMLEASTVVNASHMSGRPDDIAELVAHLSRGLEPEDQQPAALRLGAMGVGAVLVPAGTNPEIANLVGRLDTIAGLQRVTENETGTVWRVEPQEVTVDLEELLATLADPEDLSNNTVIIPAEPAWAVLYDRTDSMILENAQPLTATRLAATADLVPATADQVIVIAENAAPGWTAKINGSVVPRVTVNGMQGFELADYAAAGGTLEISYERASQIPWLVLQGTVLVVFVLLAIPMRRKGV